MVVVVVVAVVVVVVMAVVIVAMVVVAGSLDIKLQEELKKIPAMAIRLQE